MNDFDVCIIGSGAGAGPVAYELSMAGYSVVVLEKGKWYSETDFSKDELKNTLRDAYSPNLKDEYHIIESPDEEGNFEANSTYDTGNSFWNGTLVGGSSNFMSGFFHRLKPKDFRLHSEFGPVSGANIVDWPISYDDLEPYYTKVEHIVGVSGVAEKHRFSAPRSKEEFPYPPTLEHPFSSVFDNVCTELGYQATRVPRAILSQKVSERNACYYSNYCGSYGCSSGAKGSSRAALLNKALKTGNCTILPESMVHYLESDTKGRVVAAHFFDKNGKSNRVTARLFNVAALATETSRLLLLSKSEKFPNGLANNNNLVGKNLLFSAGGSGMGFLPYSNYKEPEIEKMKVRGLFMNRALEEWYFLDGKVFGEPMKGGLIEFLFRHANPVARANDEKWGDNGLLWGLPLKKRLEKVFTGGRFIRFEIFNDWLPTDNCFITLDEKAKDKWGNPVAKIRTGYHPHDLKIGAYLAQKAEEILHALHAEEIFSYVSGSPPPNLVAGGCRFGNDPQKSVLNKNCRAHDVENLYVSDGSFMPTGGSVPYTWTIYANAFRIADKIKLDLG
ncbi:GMC family oxidoreductase [candidate division KSB1 bacterium]|nr:GMC family oxidoreductase [candidate division KSB1 bacterium]